MAALSIIDSGDKLEIRCDNGHIKRYHSIWLRHQCRCEECYLHAQEQIRINPADIPYDIVIESANIEGDDVKITWKDSDHVGILPMSHILANDYSTERLQKLKEDSTPLHYLESGLPQSSYDEVMRSDVALLRWIQQINDFGVSLLTGVPTEDLAMAKAVERIGPLQDNLYGKSFEVYVTPTPINAAYMNVKLHDHQDLVMYEVPPGLQFLHCLKFDNEVSGGESTFLDLFHVVNEFRKSNPKEFDTLTKIPVTFVRKHYKRENPVDMEIRKPHIMLNDQGEVICVNWHPGLLGPLRVNEKLVPEYYRASYMFAKAVVESPLRKLYRLRPGDAICMNNRRLTHGREEFKLNGGERLLQGMYVSIDDLKSKLRYLLTSLNEKGTVKRTGGNDW